MKKQFTIEAINLKNYPLNDNDSIVVMFSKTKGLMKAIAKGTKRPKSKLGARVQMFIANKLMLSEGRNFDNISEATSLNTFSKIRSNIDKLTYAMYISECVNSFCSKQFNQDENYSEIYDLIYSAYNKIALLDKKEDIILSALKFQIKFMNILGWGIDFENCSMCQKPLVGESVFSFNLGAFLCCDCLKQENNIQNIKIHEKIRMFLAEISKTDFNSETKYDKLANLAVLEKCFNFMKKYMDSISHKKTHVFEILDCFNTAEFKAVQNG